MSREVGQPSDGRLTAPLRRIGRLSVSVCGQRLWIARGPVRPGNTKRMSASISLVRAGRNAQSVLERLWQLYRHDLSEFRPSMVPQADGTYPLRRLPSYIDDSDRAAYLMHPDGDDDRPVGFVLVAGLQTSPRTVDEFFVVRALRRQRVGHAAAAELLRLHPGPWEIYFQEENPAAARFWRRVAADAADTCQEERRPVPGKPELPPDVVVTFEANTTARGSAVGQRPSEIQ